MYIRHLHVQNLKRLSNFTLDFEHAGEPRMWTVLIGENGTAKTTLLQAIALAAAGSKQVNTLGGRIVKHLRDRRADARMSIEARFDFTPLSRSEGREVHPMGRAPFTDLGLVSEVSLDPGSTSLDASARYFHEKGRGAMTSASPRETKDPLDAARAAHTPLWFVAGYGISRVLPDPTSTPPLDRPSIDRMLPLFDTQVTLASTSFSNHFLKKDVEEGRPRGTTSRSYSRMLNAAIKLGGRDLLPDISKLELRGQGGTTTAGDLIESDRFHQHMGRRTQRIAGVALSHGYQSTFAWMADLIGHVLLESKTELDTTDMEGLVLLDEIDLYLHPTWQSTFVTALRRVFPKMQFVATTHSPVVLAALAPHEIVRLMVDPESGDIVQVGWDPKTGEIVPANDRDLQQPDPRPMTGSELYRTWFGLDRLTPNPHGDELRQYMVLAGDPFRSTEEDKEVKRLGKMLDEAGISDRRPPVPRKRER